MDSQMEMEKVEKLIGIFQDLFDGKYGDLSEENKNLIRQKLREAKMEFLLGWEAYCPMPGNLHKVNVYNYINVA